MHLCICMCIYVYTKWKWKGEWERKRKRSEGSRGTREGNGTVGHGSRREDDVGEASKAARCREVRETLVREANRNRCNYVCVCVECHS